MPRSIIYIINPVSGTKDKKGLEKFITDKMNGKKIPFSIFPSVASGDYSFLIPVIKEKKITDIVIAGGDGTVSQVVGSLAQTGVDFGILPCGSGNGLAYTAGIPMQPEKALELIFAQQSSAIDGFTINDRFACMLCGLGFDAKVAHDFAQQPGRGLSTYVRQVIKNFFSAKTYKFDLETGDKKISVDAFFMSIANSNQYGNNFTIAPQASLTDGLLDVVIVTRQSKLNFILSTLQQVRGKYKLIKDIEGKEKKAVLYFQTDKLRIINASEAPLHIDGDPAETIREINIEVKKKCFRLFQPQ